MYPALVVKAQSAEVCNYHLIPKFHNLAHLAGYVRESKRNLQFDHCYSDEGLMGFVSKLASATHASTMGRRVLERYRVQLDVVQSLLKRQSHSPSPGLKRSTSSSRHPIDAAGRQGFPF